MATTKVKDKGTQQICEHEPVEPKTYYVRLCTGELREVTRVTNVHLTGQKVVLVRGEEAPVTFPRAVVFAVDCEECLPPILT